MKRLLVFAALLSASITWANEKDFPPRYPPIPTQPAPPQNLRAPVPMAPTAPVATPIQTVAPITMAPVRTCNVVVVPIFDSRGYLLYNRYFCR